MKNETMELKSLRVFLATANQLNFTRAAEELRLPKSQVSKIVAQLEDRLQTPLFERTSRVVRLTEAGRILAIRARSLLAEADLMIDDVKALQQGVGGELKLAAPPALGRYVASELLPEFLRRWPGVSVSLKLSYEYEDLFKEGLDLAFRMGGHRDDSLIEKPLGFANRVIVAAPEYLREHKPIATPADLSAHVCVQVFASEYANWQLCKDGVVSNVSVRSIFQCSDMLALRSLLLEGAGVAQLPWLVVRDDIRAGRLREVLPGWVSEGLTISAVYRQGVNKPAKLAEFLELVEQNKSLFDLSRPEPASY